MKFFKRFDLNKVKALSFDLDDTLYDNHPVILKAENDFALYLQNRYHLPDCFCTNSFWASIKNAVGLAKPRLKDDVTKLRVYSLLEAFNAIRKPLQGGVAEAEALVAYFVTLRSQAKVPSSTFNLLKQLREHYPVAALSNGNADLKILGLQDCFDYNLRPCYLKIKSKPNADLFINYAAQLNLKPHNILHIGDEPFSDIHGAVYAGCQCAWLYKGFAGDSPDAKELRVLPQVLLHDLKELKTLLRLQ